MTITKAQLRADYPEFASTTVYPDVVVDFWLNQAYRRLLAPPWDNAPPVAPLVGNSQLDYGVEFYVCHELTLEARAQAQATAGAPPGETVGALASKSVSKVSVGYDTNSTAQEGAGYYNQTIYGKRFWSLAMQVGASGVTQLGLPCG